MPVADEIKSSWADEVDEIDEFPPTQTKVEGNTKTVIEYTLNKDDKKVKVVSFYKIEKHKVAKSIAQRKTLKKFGLSSKDKPGPNPATTITAEEVQMQFITGKEEEPKDAEEIKKKLVDSAKGQVKCRLCKEEHWTKQCPYKDKLEPIDLVYVGDEKDGEEGGPPSDKKPGGPSGGPTQGKYVPPSMREGGSKKGESMMPNRNRDETATVRVTNLSESTREQDLSELFKPLGDISRIFLAKDKITQASKGFAFINYKRREDAAKAIQTLNGFGYDHLILSVEWARPSEKS